MQTTNRRALTAKRKRKPKRRDLQLVPPQPQPEPDYPGFNVLTLLTGLADPAWIICNGDSYRGICDGDLLLIDRANKTPRKGEMIVTKDADGFTLTDMRGHSHIRDASEPQREIYGTVAYSVRRLLPGAPPWEITP